MADHRGLPPLLAHGGNQYPAPKMPAAVPNGVPPQWGQEGELKATLTSQNLPSVTATNGTRSSSQHSHPGSLSSHSSRDSSPAPSRIGVVHPNAWSSGNPPNHSPLASSNPTNNQGHYQQPNQSSNNTYNPTVMNHSQPVGASSVPHYQPSLVQNMPPTGSVPPRPQQNLPTPHAPVSQPSVPATQPPAFGPSVPQLGNNSSFELQPSLQNQRANALFLSSAPHAFQSHAASSSSSGMQQDSFGPPQYSQAPSNQQVAVGQQQNPLSSERPIASAFPKMVTSSPMTMSTMQVSSTSGPEGLSRPAQHMLPGQQLSTGSALQVPTGISSQVTLSAGAQTSLRSGEHLSPGAVNQLPSGPGSQMPPTQAHHLPPGSRQQVPPSLGQHAPTFAGPQMPHNFSQQLPPGPSPQMPSAPRHQAPKVPPVSGHGMPLIGQPVPSNQGQQMSLGTGQLQSTARSMPPMVMQQIPTSPGQNVPTGSASFQQSSSINPVPSVPRLQMYPGQQALQRPPGPPPAQGTHLQLSSTQWPSGSSAIASSVGVPPRGPLPVQQGPYNAPPCPQPYSSSQQQLSMSNLTQPNQSLSGPPLQRSLAPTGQFMSNQNHLAQPLSSQPPGFVGNDTGFRRYPQHPQSTGQDSLMSPMSTLSVTQTGFNKLWGQENYDLLQNRNILPPEKVEAPQVRLTADFENSANCSPDIFRCTLTRIPETDSLLKKSRLPLGVLIHPFKDLNNLPVIQCTPIVRCRVCRTYINPFVYFMDEKHWKCNLCFRVNELPDEFHYDPATKTYGEPMRRPEVKSSTIEFIAPAEYMLRPPQPAVYLFLLDVSRLAVESGYLQLVCETLLAELDRLPGDSRTSVGFITYDSAVHFYSLAEGLSAPQQMVVMDIDDVFLPCPENLLANLGERRDLIQNMLVLLPSKFSGTYDTGSALGAALQAAFKLMSPTGGRVTVFQCCLPNTGPGALKAREDPANRASKDVPHLNPATDFYKQLALEFSGQQTAVDLFLLNQQYSDLATISGVARFSGGCIYHFPLFQSNNIQLSESFENAFRRYLDRKIGFEAVMRIRCSRGLSIHTFHGNFYVRSTDLLSLPNINPDAGFGMQVSIEENLSDMQTICFQAALLYTSGKGERRIRVHTLCLPIAASLPDILHSADQQCIIGLLAKMAVDRSQQSSLSDARDAFINVVIDALSAYKLTQSSSVGAGLLAPRSLRLLPLYILALLKNMAFRSGTSTRLDDRVFAMCQMKTLPLTQLIQFIYPDLYPVHCLDQYEEIMIDNVPITTPPRLHLSAEKINSQGAVLMDAGDQLLILVGRAIPLVFCENVLGVSSFSAIPEDMYELPDIDCEDSRKLRNFVSYLQSEKPYCVNLHVIREDSKLRSKFFDRLIEDRTESSLSYYEFLQHIKSQIK